MNQSIPVQSGAGAVLNRLRTFFSKPHNVILLILGIILTVTTGSAGHKGGIAPSINKQHGLFSFFQTVLQQFF